MARARVKACCQVCRARAGTCRKVGVCPAWMAASVGKAAPPPASGGWGPTAAARASGRQVGWTPCLSDTLSPQTKHRVRPCCWSQVDGTSPAKEPERWASMWARIVVWFAYPLAFRRVRGRTPRHRAKGPSSCPARGGSPSPSTSIAEGPPASAAGPRRGDRGARSPPSGVPSNGRQVKEIMRPTGPRVGDKWETNERQMGDK